MCNTKNIDCTKQIVTTYTVKNICRFNSDETENKFFNNNLHNGKKEKKKNMKYEYEIWNILNTMKYKRKQIQK